VKLHEGGSTAVGTVGVVYGLFYGVLGVIERGSYLFAITPSDVRAFGQELLGVLVLLSSAYLIWKERKAAVERRIYLADQAAHKGEMEARVEAAESKAAAAEKQAVAAEKAAERGACKWTDASGRARCWGSDLPKAIEPDEVFVQGASQ
jgi:hypothetical protein